MPYRYELFYAACAFYLVVEFLFKCRLISCGIEREAHQLQCPTYSIDRVWLFSHKCAIQRRAESLILKHFARKTVRAEPQYRTAG